jgi:hypothetical protein
MVAIVSRWCLLLGFAEFRWMDVAAVRAVNYLLTEETLVQRGAQTEAKRGWDNLHGLTDPGLFCPSWAHLLHASFFCRFDLLLLCM